MGIQDINKVLGEKIRNLREIKGVSQMDLAYHLGYESTGAISQIENGIRGMGKRKMLQAAKFFGIHESILFSDKQFTRDQLEVFINLTTLIEKSPDSHHYEVVKSILANAVKDLNSK